MNIVYLKLLQEVPKMVCSLLFTVATITQPAVWCSWYESYYFRYPCRKMSPDLHYHSRPNLDLFYYHLFR